jgi:hypothetical protein
MAVEEHFEAANERWNMLYLKDVQLTLKGPKWPLRPRVFDCIFKYLPMKLECSQFCIQSSLVAWIMENVVMPCLK